MSIKIRYSIVIILWLATMMTIIGREHQADEVSIIASIEKKGGVVERDTSAAGQPVRKVFLEGAATDEDLKEIGNLGLLSSLHELDISHSKITDAGLECVCE